MKPSIKKVWATLAASLIGGHLQGTAQTVLSEGHTDIGLAYENGELELHVHNEVGDLEYSPGEVVLQAGMESLQLVPSGAAFSFLGNAGDNVYILPQTENPALLFLGLGGEELAGGVFEADRVAFTLRGVAGAGEFALYTVDGFGNPSVFMNSRDGLEGDSVFVTSGSHQEYNWAFSEPGDYTLTFEAEGTLIGGGTVGTGPVDVHFQVVPEPSAIVIASLGIAMAAFFMRGRRGR